MKIIADETKMVTAYANLKYFQHKIYKFNLRKSLRNKN